MTRCALHAALICWDAEEGKHQRPESGMHSIRITDAPAARRPVRTAPCNLTEGGGSHHSPAHRSWNRTRAAAALACLLALSACGGGGDVAVVQPAPLQVAIMGGAASYAPVDAGQFLDVTAPVGGVVQFDANEPVDWSFSVNGSPLFGSGTTVDVGGVTIRQDQVSPSRVVIDSFFYGPALLPIQVLLTATSSIDATQVATIRLFLQ